ncbi:MAG: DUF2905 domain-containing protein [Limisphaerales bacterium]
MVIGLLLAVTGALLWSGVGRGWLGRTPGDFHYSEGHVSFFFPLATCFLISLLLTVIFWLLHKF